MCAAAPGEVSEREDGLDPIFNKIAVAGWSSTIEAWGDRIVARWNELGSVWTLIQLGIIFGCFLLALLGARWLTPKFEAYIRRIKQQPRLIKLLAILLRRLQWFLFALLLWAATMVLLETTWPSRSYIVRLTAALATAWSFISVVSRVIGNRQLGSFVAAIAWGVTALVITGTFEPVYNALDKVALSMGGMRISVLLVLKAVLLISFLLWAARLVSDIIDQRLLTALSIQPATAVLIGKIIRAALIFLVVVTSFSAIGIDVTTLAVFSGAVGLGIGFGLQKVASNLISGFIILSDRSVKPGDVISLGNTFGWITALRARYVQVNTRDGIEYLIPNENFITERLANMSYSDRSIRLEVKFGVSYDCDPHQVREIAMGVVKGMRRVIADPPPICHVTAFGDSSVDFVLRFWIQDPENGMTNIRGEVFLGLWDGFKANGIVIPYPHREVILKSPVKAQEAPTPA